MKKIIKLFLIGTTLLLATTSNAQNTKSITIENVSSEVVWPAVFDAFKELKYPRPLIATQQGTGETSYYNYKSLMIKNRLRFKLNYQENKLTISIFERQYYTKSGWGDNPLPMSKKQVAKILNPIKERVTELTKNKIYASTNNKTLNNKETKNITKAGIYDDFVIVRTDDSEMDVLAMHKNGALIGYDLWDDNKTIKSMVFKEKENSEAITMSFDEQGFPKGMVTEQYIINISPADDETVNIAIYDLKGISISDKKVKFEKQKTSDIEIIDGNLGHGPFPGFTNSIIELNNLADYMGYASTALQVVACASAVSTGVGIIVAGPACGSLLLDLTLRVLPKENFLYDELEVVQNIFALASFSSPVGKMEVAAIIIDELKNSVTSAENIINKYFPEPEIIIEGPSIIRIGLENEVNNSSVHGATVLYAKSNFRDIPITWKINTKRMGSENTLYFFPPLEKDHKEYRENYSGVVLMGRQSYDFDLMNDEGQIIETGIIIEAKQVVNGKEIITQKQIEIHNPKYYYFPYPDCTRLYEMKLISKVEEEKCIEQKEKCNWEIWDNGGVILVNDPRLVSAMLSAHQLSASGLTDSNQSSDSKKLNFTRKFWKKDGSFYSPEEEGQFREFVKPAPCMKNWFGFDDKQTIILLAHEAMEKIEIIENKIKGLQSAANETNYLKIGSDIKSLEDSSEKIRDEYGDKINNIAIKGTIQFSTTQTDKAKYYLAKGVRVVGAHWTNSWLSILLNYETSSVQYLEKIKNTDITMEFNGAKEIRLTYFDENGETITKMTVPIGWMSTPTGAIDLSIFEKLNKIDFRDSLPITKPVDQ